jgi:pyruvate dehydrogenase E2 component (dihydrolipoamide acetyltransferase)
MDIKIPPLGEGASSGTVINILVKEGDTIKKDQTVIELENEKAVAPIPSTQAGTVSKILVSVGAQVSVGQSIITLTGSGSNASVTTNVAPQVNQVSTPKQHQNVSVPTASPAPVVAMQNVSYQPSSGKPGAASPMIRRIARQIGLDLARVSGSERGGRIVLEDVKSYIQYLQAVAFSSGGAPQSPDASAKPVATSIDFSKWGSVKKNALSPLRKKIAEKMHESWSTIPHVTQNDEVDVTDLMKVIKNHAASYEKAGARLTLTAVILKACVQALKNIRNLILV